MGAGDCLDDMDLGRTIVVQRKQSDREPMEKRGTSQWEYFDHLRLGLMEGGLCETLGK